MLSSAIERAQKKIESNNFGIRKNLLEYDQVMNEQRELVYAQRRRVLDGEDMHDQILSMIHGEIEAMTGTVMNDGMDKDEWDLHELNRILTPIIPINHIKTPDIEDVSTVSDLNERIYEEAVSILDSKIEEFPTVEDFHELERVVLLRVIDRHWMEEIDNMDQLRQGIGLQAYGQRNPVDEYKMASYDMMDAMNDAIRTDVVTMLYRVRVEKKVEREEVAKVTGTNKDDSASSGPKKRKAPKVYPNDPCPCGSGKKYKNCHGNPKMAATM